MPDFSALFKDGVFAAQQKREPTKLECGLLGALLASIVLAFFFWLGLQLSLLELFHKGINFFSFSIKLIRFGRFHHMIHNLNHMWTIWS